MQNSERRRKALMSNCACIRLESAIRTVIADVGAVNGRLMKQGSERNVSSGSCDLRGVAGTTQGNASHYLGPALKSGQRLLTLWKICTRVLAFGRIRKKLGGTFQECGVIPYLRVFVL